MKLKYRRSRATYAYPTFSFITGDARIARIVLLRLIKLIRDPFPVSKYTTEENITYVCHKLEEKI